MFSRHGLKSACHSAWFNVGLKALTITITFFTRSQYRLGHELVLRIRIWWNVLCVETLPVMHLVAKIDQKVPDKNWCHMWLVFTTNNLEITKDFYLLIGLGAGKTICLCSTTSIKETHKWHSSCYALTYIRFVHGFVLVYNCIYRFTT